MQVPAVVAPTYAEVVKGVSPASASHASPLARCISAVGNVAGKGSLGVLRGRIGNLSLPVISQNIEETTGVAVPDSPEAGEDVCGTGAWPNPGTHPQQPASASWSEAERRSYVGGVPDAQPSSHSGVDFGAHGGFRQSRPESFFASLMRAVDKSA